MNRRNDLIAEHGAWFYAASDLTEATIADARVGTWRAMEAALKAGKVRAWLRGRGHACQPTRGGACSREEAQRHARSTKLRASSDPRLWIFALLS